MKYNCRNARTNNDCNSNKESIDKLARAKF